MAKELTVEELVERAAAAQADRLGAFRELAETGVTLASLRAEATRRLAEVERENARRLAEVERDNAQSIVEAHRLHSRDYQAAKRAGWTPEELKSLGFSEPESKSPARKRTAAKAAKDLTA